jgi:hypothetical protein
METDSIHSNEDCESPMIEKDTVLAILCGIDVHVPDKISPFFCPCFRALTARYRGLIVNR